MGVANMRLIAVIATTALLLLAVPAMAQVPADLFKCATIARDADRLACYDDAVAAANPQARAAAEARAKESARIAAEEAAAAAVAAEAAAKAKAEADAVARREAFGAEGVATREDRFAPAPGEIAEIETGLTEIMANRSGLGVFLLENGQVWRQVDTNSTPNIRVGDRVKLTRAPLGGYRLNFVKQKRWVGVKRMR